MDYKRSHLLLNLGLAAGILLGLFSLMTTIQWVGILGAVLMLGGIFQAEIFYRCPRCGGRLSIREKKPAFCPHCGSPLA